MPKPHSWKSVFARLLVGVAVFALVNVITYRNNGFFQKQRAYLGQVDGIFAHPDVRLLFAGDSHVAAPLDYFNDYLPGSAYGVAVGGDSYRECFAKIRYVLERSKRIDTVVISADPHMFGQGRLESSNRSFADRYFIVAGDSSGLKQGRLSASLNLVPLFNDDFVQYLRKAAVARFSRTHASTRADVPARPWNELTEAQRSALARETGKMDHQGVGEHEQPFVWYKRILDLARTRDVRVIGVRFPVHRDYLAQVSPEKVAAIDAFLYAHGIAQIVDLRDAITDPRDFTDPDHVGRIGAAAVLRILGERIHRPLIVLRTGNK